MLNNLHVQIIVDHLTRHEFVHLTIIDLSENFLGAKNCSSLAEYIDLSTSLKQIILRSCNVGFEGVQHMVESFSQSISLKSIDLSKCGLKDDGGKIMFEAMTTNAVCTELFMGYNQLSSGSAEAIELFLKENTTLEDLCLCWNELYPEKGFINKSFVNL